MKETYLQITKRSRKYTVDGKQHLIFVYMGGHGATYNEKQIYLLNDADPNETQYEIEYKLRYLVKDLDTTAHVCAIFDCCRVNLAGLAGLMQTRKGRG